MLLLCSATSEDPIVKLGVVRHFLSTVGSLAFLQPSVKGAVNEEIIYSMSYFTKGVLLFAL